MCVRCVRQAMGRPVHSTIATWGTSIFLLFLPALTAQAPPGSESIAEATPSRLPDARNSEPPTPSEVSARPPRDVAWGWDAPRQEDPIAERTVSRRIGPIPIEGQVPGVAVELFYERSEFEFEGTNFSTDFFGGKVEMETAGASLRYVDGRWRLEGRIGTPEVRDDNIGSTSNGLLGGARVGLRALEIGRITAGLEAGLDYASAATSTATGPDGDLRWGQGSARAAVAWTPGPTTLYAFAPYGGLGHLYIDGVHRLETGPYAEADARLTFGFVGVACEWRPRVDRQLSLHAEWLVGELDGFAISLALTF
jgi:hypothetical protein